MVDGPGWESSDQAYLCLRDRRRTEALRRGIAKQVRPGDRVVELGAGTGVLSLFAAQSGAGHVLAVEGDPLLADTIERCAHANGLSELIDVVHGDARELQTSESADVIICELLDTGLIGESLIPVLNAAMGNGLISDSTRFVPSAYETYLQATSTSHEMYGLWMPVLRHEWGFYTGNDWLPVDEPGRGSARKRVWGARFSACPLEEHVLARVPLAPGQNTLEITGRVELGDATWHGGFLSMNGPKLVPLPDELIGASTLVVEYTMGAGLSSLGFRSAQ